MQRYDRLRAEVSQFIKEIEIMTSKKDKEKTEDIQNFNLLEMAEEIKVLEKTLKTIPKRLHDHNMSFGEVENNNFSIQSDLTNQLLTKISSLTEENEKIIDGNNIHYELYYNKEMQQNSKLAHLHEMDRRLSSLEQMMTGSIYPELKTNDPKGLYEIVQDLKSKIELLNETDLGNLLYRMEKVSQNFENLKSSRSNQILISSDTEQKIDSVFKAVNDIEVVASELPIVVDRMVQLKFLHEQAVQFSYQINNMSSKQDEISQILDENLKSMSALQDSLAKNMKIIEANVISLEKRIVNVSNLLASANKNN